MARKEKTAERRLAELTRAYREQRLLLGHLEQRLSHLENSIYQHLSRAFNGILREVRQLYRTGAVAAAESAQYDAWLQHEGQLAVGNTRILRAMERMKARPRFSVLVVPGAGGSEFKAASMDSLQGQTYPPVDAAESPDELRGDFIAILRAGDRLHPDALFWCARRLQGKRWPDWIYTDEDSIDSRGRRSSPIFKPDWSPTLLLGGNYVGGLLVVSRSSFESAGGWQTLCPGAEDYDLALRLTDQPGRVEHIPRLLYHRRGPVLHNGPAAKAALERAVERRKWDATVEESASPGWCRVAKKQSSFPLVSVIICSRNAAFLSLCLKLLKARTTYPNWEVVVVQHMVKPNPKLVRATDAYNARGVPYVGAFHYPRMNWAGAQAAKGDILLFLNDDIEPVSPAWMSLLVAHLARPKVGIAGARLLYPSGLIQHAGIAVVGGAACHPGRGLLRSELWRWFDRTREISAVTGACLAIPRSLFEKLDGFDLAFPVNYNDVDLCLRAREAGWDVIYDADAILLHRESATRKAFVSLGELELFSHRWARLMRRGDPFYSTCLRDIETPSLIFH